MKQQYRCIRKLTEKERMMSEVIVFIFDNALSLLITNQRRMNVTKCGGGHIWRAQHRDASHAKVTSQISVGSMSRPKFWVWKWGGHKHIFAPPSQKGGAHAPLPTPRFLRQC